MRTLQPLLRPGVTLVAAALPLAPAAGAAVAASGISVSTSGTTVSVTTGACSRIGDRWGTASLLNSGQTTFAQGRQLPLSGTAAGQSATWPYVGAGTYTVVVMCSNGNTAGTQSVIVSPAAAPSRAASRAPTISATASPSRGVMGGLGGTARDYGTVTLVAGGALVGAGTVGAAWYLRSRTRPRRY